MERRHRQVFGWIAAAALTGIGAAALVGWHSITVEVASPDDALSRYAEVRGRLAWSEPILRVDKSGVVSRRLPPSGDTATPPTRLYALAYRAAEQRLIRADVPFWLLKVKGPAAQYALRGTGVDLEQLAVTPADLQSYGPSVVLDEIRGERRSTSGVDRVVAKGGESSIAREIRAERHDRQTETVPGARPRGSGAGCLRERA